MLASKKIWLYAGVVAALTVVSLFLHSYRNVPDPDSFYHLRHAWVYRTSGLGDSSFPWAQYSIIRTFGADLWYGFHVLVIPLTYFKDLLAGINVGGILTTIIAGLLIYLALVRLRVKWPVLWLFIFLLSSADILYRIAMLRPHPFSLSLGLLTFALLNEERPKNWLIFLASAMLAWIHISLSWLLVLIWLVIAALRLIQKQGLLWKEGLAVGAGLLAGLMLRPHPVAAAKLAYIQIVQLFIEQSRHTPLVFGHELTPLRLENFLDQMIPISILTALALGFFVWLILKRHLPDNLKVRAWSSLALAAVFFYLSFSSARRAEELFIGFAVFFIALLFSHYQTVFRKNLPTAVTLLAVAVLAYMPFQTFSRFNDYMANAYDPNQFKEAALWLKDNTKPREIVFNLHWDQFAQLFFWNPQNYYINGMDPIFEYSYDPSLYWKTHFLAKDLATAFTCGQIRCRQEEVEDTHTVLKRDFRASYVLLKERRNPKMYDYLNSAPGFEKVFDNRQDAIYKIL